MHFRHHSLLIAINNHEALTFWKSIETTIIHTNHHDLLKLIIKESLLTGSAMKSIVDVMVMK